MITSAQADKICSLLVDYREAIVELTTAAPEDRMAAAYNFADIDRTVHGLLHSWVGTSAPESGSDVRIEWVEASASDGGSDGWIEWGGGECPVETGTLVDVRYRGGKGCGSVPANVDSEGWRDADSEYWRNDGFENDIVAYRVVRN